MTALTLSEEGRQSIAKKLRSIALIISVQLPRRAEELEDIAALLSRDQAPEVCEWERGGGFLGMHLHHAGCTLR